MDGHNCSSELDSCEPEELGVAPSPPSSGSSGATGTKPSRRHQTAADSSASSPSAKRSRRTVQKRVVTVPISETKGGAGEGAPPSDSWAWRKYGQKPIKGSPYPRGYYRCSSSKGCPARKQVERSGADPSTIVVTYSFDHNHAWPITKNHNHHHKAPAAAPEPAPVREQPPLLALVQQQEQQQQQHTNLNPPTGTESSPPESAERDEKFSDLIGDEESSLLMPDGGFNWLGDVGSPASTSPAASDELLYGSVFFGGPTATVTTGFPPEEEREESTSAVGGGGCEDDALFDGLGELPEYSVVFRRGAASAAWMGTGTGTTNSG